MSSWRRPEVPSTSGRNVYAAGARPFTGERDATILRRLPRRSSNRTRRPSLVIDLPEAFGGAGSARSAAATSSGPFRDIGHVLVGDLRLSRGVVQ
jgi:hypothetical protein